MTPTTIATSGPWSLLLLPGAASNLVLSCASIGHDPSRPPSPEWVKTATSEARPALFLIDRSRSWATAPGLSEILTRGITILRARQSITRILALGTSLGAFTALAATHILPIDVVVSIGPQHQPAAPWEPRWRDWTKSLDPTLVAPAPLARHSYILHGSDDVTQAMGFARRPSPGPLDHLFFADQTHATLAAHLKPAMPSLIAAAFAQDRRRFLRLIAQASGRRLFAEKLSTH